MATHKSAEKRARQTVRRNKLNRARRSSVQTLVHAVDTAIAGGDKDVIVKATKAAEAGLARSASRGTLHWKTAARKTSRLAKRAKAAATKA